MALGSNLGDSAALVRQAMSRLEPRARGPLQRSSLWQSAPVDCPANSPPFVNAVVTWWAGAEETPEGLLGYLQGLESEFGRRPKQMLNEPRPLDLDLIALGGEQRNTARLVLPHPRAAQRRFVLEPLAEIAPDLILPGQSRSVRQLLAALAPTAEWVRLVAPR